MFLLHSADGQKVRALLLCTQHRLKECSLARFSEFMCTENNSVRYFITSLAKNKFFEVIGQLHPCNIGKGKWYGKQGPRSAEHLQLSFKHLDFR